MERLREPISREPRERAQDLGDHACHRIAQIDARRRGARQLEPAAIGDAEAELFELTMAALGGADRAPEDRPQRDLTEARTRAILERTQTNHQESPDVALVGTR